MNGSGPHQICLFSLHQLVDWIDNVVPTAATTKTEVFEEDGIGRCVRIGSTVGEKVFE